MPINKLDPWPKIGSKPSNILYRAKVKLHGTNAAVQCFDDGRFVPQSRTRTLNPPHTDNLGFGAFVKENSEYFSGIRKNITIYGEWCGPGIQKGVAASEVPCKFWAIFAIKDRDKNVLEVNSNSISAAIITHDMPKNIHVLPWIEGTFDPFGDPDKINSLIEEIENEDPFIKDVFGISGVGEGAVFYPVSGLIFPETFAEHGFKAKGERHRVVGQRKALVLNPEKIMHVDEFVTKVVTGPRLEQGLQEACHGRCEPELTGIFIKWIQKDIKEECFDTLTDSGLSWKDVSKAISRKASQWYLSE